MTRLACYWASHRAFRDAVYGALSLGSIGWVTGETVPGPVLGTEPVRGLLLFTLLFGAIGLIVGYVIGTTVDQSTRYYQGEEPPGAAPEPTA